jgi:alkylation response protein AidB-like acyl-CoA dehydrogenase
MPSAPGLLLEPYLAAAVVAPALIRRTASADFQEQWLPNIASGESIVVLAHADAAARRSPNSAAISAGARRVVAHGGCADLLLVSAQTPAATPRCLPSRRAATASPCATTRRSTASARRTSCWPACAGHG